MILPLGTRSNKLGKWSPCWECPFKITRIVPGNSYFVEALDGRELLKALNGKYLKRYHPSIGWLEHKRRRLDEQPENAGKDGKLFLWESLMNALHKQM
jgi:hypothetical protein